MNWFKGFFSEVGDQSMMRLLSFMCVITACLVAFYAVASSKDLSATALLIAPLLTAGIGGKVIQKNSEVKEP